LLVPAEPKLTLTLSLFPTIFIREKEGLVTVVFFETTEVVVEVGASHSFRGLETL
jgi:hypothetical protein